MDIGLQEFYRCIQLAPAITTFLPEEIGKGEITRISTNNGYQASSWDLVYDRETEVNVNRLHEYDLTTIKTRRFQTEESLLPTECKLLCRLFCRVRLHTAALALSIVSHAVGDSNKKRKCLTSLG